MSEINANKEIKQVRRIGNLESRMGRLLLAWEEFFIPRKLHVLERHLLYFPEVLLKVSFQSHEGCCLIPLWEPLLCPSAAPIPWSSSPPRSPMPSLLTAQTSCWSEGPRECLLNNFFHYSRSVPWD